MTPTVDIRIADVVTNLKAVSALTAARGIGLTVVTKALVGYRPVVERLVDAGATSIAEARVETLRAYADLPVERWLIRSPLMSQIDDTVRFADVSLNSEVYVIEALGRAALRQGGTHKVVIMVELGDRREGVMPDDAVDVCLRAASVPGIELLGVGTEFGCYSHVVPSAPALEQLASLVGAVENSLGRPLQVVSGGASNALHMLLEGTLPSAVNHLRVGDSILTGRVADYTTPIPGACPDPFTLRAEIIEIKSKPSKPVGLRVPGDVPVADDPHFPDLGVRRRALMAVGKQDVDIRHLTPCDPRITIQEGSSDAFVVDLTDCGDEYSVGDELAFVMDYFSILPSMVSGFVDKVILTESGSHSVSPPS